MADQVALDGLVASVRVLQRCLDGLLLKIGARADDLAESGEGKPATETMRGPGTVGARRARQEAKRAEVARQINGLADAVASGALSGEHVDAINRHRRRLPADRRDAVDFEALAQQAVGLPPETFDRLVKRTVDAVLADHGRADDAAKVAASEFRHWFDHDLGMGRFSGSLDPERYELLVNAVEHRVATLAAAGESKTPNLAAKALIDIVGGSGSVSAGRSRPSIIVVADQQTVANGPHEHSLCQTESGHDISADSLARLCCDAVVRKVTLDEHGVPLQVGRAHRTATPAQWAARKAVYSSCAWDGCDTPINWCQAHHIRYWEDGGPTDLDNLVPLCSRHHHLVHQGGWDVRLLPDRSLEILNPSGELVTIAPPPRRC